MSQPSRVHVGTVWAVPCRCGIGGVHEYKRPVVSVDIANDLQHTIDRLADFIEQNVPGAQVYRENGIVVT